ncbi:MAG: hypothetical protein ACRDSZ_22390 [Pseudonocardiaceae bacterium]
MAGNERLVGQETPLAQSEQTLSRVGAGPLAYRTGRPPDGGVLTVRNGWPRPVGDGEQPHIDQCHPQCHAVPPIGHNWKMIAAAATFAATIETGASTSLAITDLQVRYTGTAALYALRAPDVESLQQLETRVRACFEAGVLATGCAHEVTRVSPAYADLVPEPWLAVAYRVAITGLGRSPLSPENERGRQTGSTDMGNVTRVLPAIHPTIAIDCGEAVNHQPEIATACATPSADRAVCDGALALALTGLAVVTDDAQRERLIGGVSRRHVTSATTAGRAV